DDDEKASSRRLYTGAGAWVPLDDVACELERAEDARAVAERRCDQVVVEAPFELRGADVAREQLADLCADELKEPGLIHDAAADSGTDGDVAERLEAGGGAPAVLAERCGVDVRVERDRNAEGPFERGRDVGVGPARLRRRRDAAPGR